MSAYSLYDVLRTLIDRVGWPSEQERRVCIESVNEAERMNIFGNLASMMACDHARGVGRDGCCLDCKKMVTVPGGNAIR